MRHLFSIPPAVLASLLGICGLAAHPARAHPGGLDAAGCHTNRKTGEYHCHRASLSPKEPPVRSVPAPPSRVSGMVYYRNCTQARAAGVTPLLRGDPGYRAGLDRDNDGRACE